MYFAITLHLPQGIFLPKTSEKLPFCFGVVCAELVPEMFVKFQGAQWDSRVFESEKNITELERSRNKQN